MNLISLPLRLSAAAALLALASGCSSLCQLRDPATGAAIPATFTGTSGDTSAPKPSSAPVLLRSVETVSCNGFDRVVFTFDGTEVPGHFVEYIDKPVRHCGSGNVVPVAGDAFLEMRMTPAQAHTDEGEVTVADRDRTLNYTNLLQLVSTCDFEGEVTWVLGVRAPRAYRVVELTSPPRLVLDVKQ